MKKNNFIRSPFNYIGNKYRILEQIVNFFPEKKIFVDVFGGSGIVGINAKNQKVIYNEIDTMMYKVMNYLNEFLFNEVDGELFNIIKKYHLLTKKEGKRQLSQSNKTAYNQLKTTFNNENEKNITEFIILVMFGFNSQIRFNSKNEFNIPVGKSGYTKYRRENLKMFQEKLQEKEVHIYNAHYKDLLKDLTNDFTTNKDYFFYFDPPYLLSVAPYNAYWNLEKEQELIKTLEVLLENDYQFGLNNFLQKNDNYNELLKGFINKYQDKLELTFMKSNYQNSNYHKKHDDILKEIYLCTRNKVK